MHARLFVVRSRSAALAAAALLSGLVSDAALAGTLTVKGSDTMVQLVQRWAHGFARGLPGTRVQVTGGGSGVGLAALENGGTELAASSRPITEAERARLRAQWGSEPVEHVVARDAVTFYVHASNPVGPLTVEQLAAIYLGDVTNWRELGGADAPIVVYSREGTSGTYAFVKERLLHGQDFTVRAQLLPGTAAVVNAVAEDPHGIGYGGAAFARGVRVVELDTPRGPVPPSEATVGSGDYPLARELYLYRRAPGTADARAFVGWVLSEPGQQLVAAAGFFPVRP